MGLNTSLVLRYRAKLDAVEKKFFATMQRERKRCEERLQKLNDAHQQAQRGKQKEERRRTSTMNEKKKKKKGKYERGDSSSREGTPFKETRMYSSRSRSPAQGGKAPHGRGRDKSGRPREKEFEDSRSSTSAESDTSTGGTSLQKEKHTRVPEPKARGDSLEKKVRVSTSRGRETGRGHRKYHRERQNR